MAEIERIPYDDERWAAKFKVMKENFACSIAFGAARILEAEDPTARSRW